MSSRHRRVWTEFDTERFIDLVLKGRDDVLKLLVGAPVASEEYRQLSELLHALHRAAVFLGHDWAHPNSIPRPKRRHE